MFTIIICRDYEEVSNKAFAIFRDQMKKKPNSVLGLATGSSPLGTYQRLIEDHRLNGTSYRDVWSNHAVLSFSLKLKTP